MGTIALLTLSEHYRVVRKARTQVFEWRAVCVCGPRERDSIHCGRIRNMKEISLRGHCKPYFSEKIHEKFSIIREGQQNPKCDFLK